jgi:hypothetical protein
MKDRTARTIEGLMMIAIGLVVIALSAATVAAQEAPAPNPSVPHITPTPGFKAVLNVYWVDTKTLDIVSESSYWYPTKGACSDSLPKAFAIAQEAANPGEIAVLECKAVSKRGETIVPDGAQGPSAKPHVAPGTTDL